MSSSHSLDGRGGPSPVATGEFSPQSSHSLPALTLAALGIVYGDIGTSPLYTIKECFHGMHGVAVTQANVEGVLSLIFWSLMVVVSLKYVVFILRADNKGEGGIFALLALLGDYKGVGGRMRSFVVALAAMGAALLYGDGVITPAISVLSAVEGLNVATTAAADLVAPLTCGVLVGLFAFQRHGTAAIGLIFGPVMIVWFVVLGALGLREVLVEPAILAALDPRNAVAFFQLNGLRGAVVLGSVVLCITGGEALYADMGHFGRAPIRISWHVAVLPGLLLNYLGQGALLLDHPEMAFNPFYALVPKALLYPMVALATAATIIASQAMISGVFSLTQQAIQLGFSPRMHIAHTSERAVGQIYLPGVNWALMLACIALVLSFRESTRLAGAYGIAVTATMAITSLLWFEVTRLRWRWPLWRSLPLLALFLVFDLSFLGANLLKILDGGWLTLSLGGLVLLAKRYEASRVPIDVFLRDLANYEPYRSPGTAVFMSVSAQGAPLPLLHHFKHNGTIHERVILLSIASADVPHVPAEERLAIEDLGLGFHRLRARYGFMEKPDAPEIMELAKAQGLPLDIYSTSFFLGRETLLTSGDSRMGAWRKRIFAFMSRNAWNPASWFGIPPGRVVELGAQVEL